MKQNAINPRAKSLIKPQLTIQSIASLLTQIRKGDRASLAKAITLMESKLPEHRSAAALLRKQIGSQKREAFRIGITGSPGVGKSSFLEAFILSILHQDAKSQVAVLTIDPASPFQGGSVLADKTRMQKIASDPRVFIRPSPSVVASSVNHSTRDNIRLCEWAGFHYVFVETVGAGQSEWSIQKLVDATLLLVQPASGDGLQGIKRGINEMADLIVITKDDTDLKTAARKTQVEYQQAIQLVTTEPIRVMRCSSLEHTGIKDIVHALNHWKLEQKKSRKWIKKRKTQAHEYLTDCIREKWNTILSKHLEHIPPKYNPSAITSITASQYLAKIIKSFAKQKRWKKILE
jgi:LAO/AO transport system kinase